MPLDGVVALEAGGGRAAAFAGRLLAAYGATVIKIEHSNTDGQAQAHDAPAAGEQAYLDAGKLSVAFPDGPPAEAALLDRLYRASDVVVRFVGPDRAKRSDVQHTGGHWPVEVEISWFGQTGPWSSYLCDDFLAQHVSGMGFTSALRVDDTTSSGPRAVTGHLAEMVAGLTAATAAMVAISGRESGCPPEKIDISVAEAIVSFMRYETVIYSYGWGLPSRSKLARSPVAAPVFQQATADGYVDMFIMQEAPWRALLDLLGNPSWADDELFATHPLRSQYWDGLEPLLQAELRRMETAHLYGEGQRRGIAIAPVNDIAGAAAAPQFAERGFFVRQPLTGGEILAPGRPFALGPPAKAALAPTPGEHNRAILVDWLRCTSDELSKMGVIL